jgi:hypothetical protein
MYTCQLNYSGEEKGEEVRKAFSELSKQIFDTLQALDANLKVTFRVDSVTSGYSYYSSPMDPTSVTVTYSGCHYSGSSLSGSENSGSEFSGSENSGSTHSGSSHSGYSHSGYAHSGSQLGDDCVCSLACGPCVCKSGCPKTCSQPATACCEKKNQDDSDDDEPKRKSFCSGRSSCMGGVQ